MGIFILLVITLLIAILFSMGAKSIWGQYKFLQDPEVNQKLKLKKNIWIYSEWVRPFILIIALGLFFNAAVAYAAFVYFFWRYVSGL